MRLLKNLICAAALLAPMAAPAQGLFSPAISVNDSAITRYEIDQRVKLLTLFRTAGNLNELAREQLIDERLRMSYLQREGLNLSDDGLKNAMTEFATRGGRTYEEFLDNITTAGVAEQTVRDFVAVNTLWRELIRSKFNRQVTITDAEIDAALASNTTNPASLQVLISEIIIPAPPEKAAEVAKLAEDISQMTSTSDFSAAAREYSATRSRDDGGRLPWQNLTELPEGLHGLLISLEPGQVTPPLQLENAVALLQMRDLREIRATASAPSEIDYAVFTIPGGLTEAALSEAARIDAETDTCDDLYGIAHGQPEDRLTRTTATPSEIDTDIALELAKFDAGESSAILTRNDGQTLLFVMMCNRIPQSAETIDRAQIENRLRSEKLAGYADALLAQLRDTAVISTQ
jgi:peptidyl-prolyl cis-trans isomerase SurA